MGVIYETHSLTERRIEYERREEAERERVERAWERASLRRFRGASRNVTDEETPDD